MRRAFRVRSSRWGRGSLWVRRWMVWVMAWAKRPAGMARMSRLGTAEMSHRRSVHVAGAVVVAVRRLVRRLSGGGREAVRMGGGGGRGPRGRRWRWGVGRGGGRGGMAWAKRPAGMARMSRLGTAEMSHRRSFHVAGSVMMAVLRLVMPLSGMGR